MERKNLNRTIRLNLISAIILLVGLSLAVSIYLRAGDDSYGVLGYEGGDGSVYPINPEDSKQYLRDLELYGGKANVLADQFRRWFGSLWHDKSLAFLVAGTTIMVSFGFFYAANYLLPPLNSDVSNGRHRDGTGE